MHSDQAMKTALSTTTLILFLSVAAQAQEFGVRGGVAAEPAFAFGGIRFAFSPSPGGPIVRLTLDLAGGAQAARIFTAAYESPKLHRASWSWSPYFGGGLTILLWHVPPAYLGGDRLVGGWAMIFGAEYRRRISIEVQLNVLGDTPRAYVAVGYRLR